MRRLPAGVMLALVGLMAVPALAADHTITAGPTPDSFTNTDVTIDQGDTITFSNTDSGGFMHNVTEDTSTEGRSGDPRFKSDTIGPGKTSPVAGVEYLTTGDYAFYCTIHPFMKGMIHVTANGTPKQRTTPPPDKTPPDASVAISDAKIGAVVKRKALKVALTTNEAATFKLTAKSGKTVIAKGTLKVTGTKRSVSIALTSAGRKLLTKSKSVTLKLGAVVSDDAGNRAAASATRKLRR